LVDQVASVADAVALATSLRRTLASHHARRARVSGGIVTAGAIFLGNGRRRAGHYVAGPSMCADRRPGAILRRSDGGSIQRARVWWNKPRVAEKALKTVKKFAELEGLGAHGKARSACRIKNETYTRTAR